MTKTQSDKNDSFVAAFVARFQEACPTVDCEVLTKFASSTADMLNLSAEELVKLALARLNRNKKTAKQASASVTLDDIKTKYASATELAAVGAGIASQLPVETVEDAALQFALVKQSGVAGTFFKETIPAAWKGVRSFFSRAAPKAVPGAASVATPGAAFGAADVAANTAGHMLPGAAAAQAVTKAPWFNPSAKGLGIGLGLGVGGPQAYDFMSNYNKRLRDAGAAEARGQFGQMFQNLPQETLYQNPMLLSQMFQQSQNMTPEYQKYTREMIMQWLQNMAAAQQYNLG